MAPEAAAGGWFPRRSGADQGFQWVSSAPSAEMVARLEASFPSVVRLPVGEIEEEMASWCSRAVIARSYRKWIPAEALIREFRRAGIHGEIEPISLQFRCHIFRFESSEACATVLNRPWVVNGQAVGISEWKPEFSPAEDSVPEALLWIRLPNLPLEFWKEEFLRAIVEPAGAFVCADSATLEKQRGGFARVCIRADLRLPLRPGTRLQGIFQPFWQQFIFENLEGHCSLCGSLHLGGPCAQSAMGAGDRVDSNVVYGPWLVANRQRKPASGPQSSGSRQPQQRDSAGPSQPQQRDSSGIGSASKGGRQPQHGSRGEDGGWVVPVKIARRRSLLALINPGPLAVVAAPQGLAEVQGLGDQEGVPGPQFRAGCDSNSKFQPKVVKSSSRRELVPVSVESRKPFASRVNSDAAASGSLKRARPEATSAPRVRSRDDKRKGKGVAIHSNPCDGGIPESDRLALVPVTLDGGQLQTKVSPVCEGSQSVEDAVMSIKGHGPDTVDLALPSLSTECKLVRVGCQVCPLEFAEGSSLSGGCHPDSVMSEARDGPLSPPV